MDQLFRMKLTIYIRNMVTKTKAIISEQSEHNPDTRLQRKMNVYINQESLKTKNEAQGPWSLDPTENDKKSARNSLVNAWTLYWLLNQVSVSFYF